MTGLYYKVFDQAAVAIRNAAVSSGDTRKQRMDALLDWPQTVC
jgi:hypothetical protein